MNQNMYFDTCCTLPTYLNMQYNRQHRKNLHNFPCRPICYLCEGQIKNEHFRVSIEPVSTNCCVRFESRYCVCLHNYMVSSCTSQSWHSITVIMTMLPAGWSMVWILGGTHLEWLWGPTSLWINAVHSQQKSGRGMKLTTCLQTVPWLKMSTVTPLLLLLCSERGQRQFFHFACTWYITIYYDTKMLISSSA
jgi:hypothetical protein